MPSVEAIPELLGDIGFNAMYLGKLAEQCQKEGGIVPFVGAGMSAPFGFPQWGEFLLGTANNQELKAEIQERLDALEYEEAASLVGDKLGWRAFEDLLRRSFNDEKLPVSLAGAVTQLAKFRPGPIVTTNFDHVLETAFRDAGRPLLPIWHSHAVRGAEALQHNRPLLLKMHGDWEDSENRILTRKQYEDAYGDLDTEHIDHRRPLPQLLNILLPSRSCLFLGCSLKQDRTMRLLKTIAEQYRTMHFAAVEKPKTESEFEARSRELSNLGICPIWYPYQRHDLLDPLLGYLAAKSMAGLAASSFRVPAPPREPPNNIPRPPNETVGRYDEIHQLSSMLKGVRLVMIVGGGGCGKSRIAIEVAQEVRLGFPDGVWYVDLAELSEKADKENLVPARIGSVAGIPQQPSRPPLEALVDRFSQGKHLLIMDNCEHLVTSCRKLLAELLERCAELHVLGTSRTVLALAEERVYPLATLETPELGMELSDIVANESVQLFKARARVGFEITEANASVIAELCRHLDGIPLAIEVAAARLGVRSVAQMNKESRSLMTLLEGVEVDDLRHWRTVNAAIEWSYSLLSKPLRDFLRSLAVFDGGWTEERATALYAERLKKPGGTVNLLQKLLDNSMVVSREVNISQRFRMLEPVRQFMKEKLSAKELASYEAKHAVIFSGLVEESSGQLLKGDQSQWLDTLQSEVDNIRAAFRWALEHKDVQTALRMAAHAWRFLEIRGYFAEGRQRMSEAIGLEGADAHPLLLERALSGAGWLAYRQADFTAAKSWMERALALAEKNQNRAGISNARNDLGNVARIHGQAALAREHLTASLEMERENGNQRMVAVALYNLGAVALDQGDLEEASRKLSQSLDSFREQANSREIAFPLRSLAEVALLRDEAGLAREYAEESLAIRRGLKDSKGCADTLATIAWIEVRAGHAEVAIERVAECLALAKAIADQRTLSEALEIAALVHSKRGNDAVVVQLTAGTARIRARLGFALPPVRKTFIDEIIAAARSHMTDSEYNGLWRRGESREVRGLVDIVLNTTASS